MKHLRLFDNLQSKHDALVLHEYMIIRFYDKKGTTNLIKIISKSKESLTKNRIWSELINLTYGNQTDIYYDYSNGKYLYAMGNECEILWRGFDEEEAKKNYDMILNTNKFNI